MDIWLRSLERSLLNVCVSVQSVCDEVRVEREKSILKQGAVQHLYGRLAGTLKDNAGDASLLVRLLPRCPVCHYLSWQWSCVLPRTVKSSLSRVPQILCSACHHWRFLKCFSFHLCTCPVV